MHEEHTHGSTQITKTRKTKKRFEKILQESYSSCFGGLGVEPAPAITAQLNEWAPTAGSLHCGLRLGFRMGVEEGLTANNVA